MQIVSNGDNLPEMSNPDSLSSAKLAQSLVKVNYSNEHFLIP